MYFKPGFFPLMPSFRSQSLRIPFRRSFTRLRLLGIFLTALCAVAWGDVPDLPVEWRADGGLFPAGSDGKMVLLDFYSDFCGTCLMMEPHLSALRKRVGDRVAFRRVKLDSPVVESAVAQYHITGTPTYILYNASGKAVYRMKDRISAVVLERQVLRALGRLQPVRLSDLSDGLPGKPAWPASLPGRERAWGNLILLSFESDRCKPCQAMRPQLDGFARAGRASGLQVAHINVELPANAPDTPAVALEKERLRRLRESLKIRTLPTYILLDNAEPAARSTAQPNPNERNERGELFRVSGNIPPRSLWQAIRFFGQSGLE
jgi:thiol-disulfide isomerase/thioredoxin